MASTPEQNGSSHNGSAQYSQAATLPSKLNNTEHLTQNNGEPIVNNRNSLTVGQRGPILLEDMHMINKNAQFNREKVPERVVHARGMTAKGFFEVTDDITDLTEADVFSEVGKQTPIATRFSLVTHPKGSPESLRDTRGMAVKFYTQHGNWDLVGNNIPVFFIRDGMAFPDLVHALRPNPVNNIQEAWRILDFLVNYPESAHMLTWLLDEPGIPTDYRHMEGYGVNTFVLVNSEGKETYVKWHMYPKMGAKFMSDETAQLAGALNMRHSHATHDLFNAISAGEYPEWDLQIQTMDPKDELNFDFDPLDATKVWPTDQFPLRQVGRLVLDTNIENFHNENEQIAFSPGRVVPGITYSNDKVLQSRINAYQDTQRYRIGVNYDQLPINAPKCPFHLNSEAGAQNFTHNVGEVNYWGSSKTEDPGAKGSEAPSFKHAQAQQLDGVRVKDDIGDNGGKWDDYKQAGDRWREMSLKRKTVFLKEIGSWMADPKLPPSVQERWFDIWERVDPGISSKLRPAVAALTTATNIKDTVTGQPTEKGATTA
jgi:catalase